MGTRVQGSSLKKFTGDSGSALASHSLAGVADANCLIARIAVFRYSTASGPMLTAISDDKGNTWVLVDSEEATSGSGHRTALYLYAAYDVAAGTTVVSLDFATEDDANYVSWEVDEWSGLATASAADKTASATTESEVATSISTGATATLAQAVQTVIAFAAGPYIYAWNDVGGSGSPPSGYTLINGNTTNMGSDELPFQSCYKNVASTSPVSAAWTIPTGSGQINCAIVATFKDATATALVVEVNVDDDIASETPTEMYVHAGGRPDQVLATRYTGSSITITGTAGSYKVRLTPAPAGTSESESVTVSGFGSTYDMGYYTGTVVAV